MSQHCLLGKKKLFSLTIYYIFNVLENSQCVFQIFSGLGWGWGGGAPFLYHQISECPVKDRTKASCCPETRAFCWLTHGGGLVSERSWLWWWHSASGCHLGSSPGWGLSWTASPLWVLSFVFQSVHPPTSLRPGRCLPGQMLPPTPWFLCCILSSTPSTSLTLSGPTPSTIPPQLSAQPHCPPTAPHPLQTFLHP